MSSTMPELGSKISLISKADIRYEGRLFTVDPQECTIALASVRSFGTEDRETQYPVAPQSQVYDYILFRGSDIKDIRVLNNANTMPNDPAIMQVSVPPTLGGVPGPGQFPAPYTHPVVGQGQYPQYHPMAGFPGSVHGSVNKTTGSMLDLIGGGAQQNQSRSGTPATTTHRKSPTSDQGTQAGGSSQQRESRRGSGQQGKQQAAAAGAARSARPSSRQRQRYPSGGSGGAAAPGQQRQQQQQHHTQPQHHAQQQYMQHQYQSGQGYNRGGWRGRARGRGRGGFAARPGGKNTLKFDNDYDFEQANTEFEELRNKLAKAKIDADNAKDATNGEVDKKDDSGNETGAGEPEVEDEGLPTYDKNKSFFDNISCEAVERSKGRSQRTDWRSERKLNSETFGVALARRGAWRGRGGWRAYPPQMHHQPWRVMRGNGRGRPGAAPNNGLRQPRAPASAPAAAPAPAPAAAAK